ncbi:Vms1/Ankzf1 family peptidyl-tRNA hydrolase, partial [Streptomyces sp. T-3]|nr:Vms1/Ankzf1 family peptidyl-tRNA hydrolase [Streptomyces sp. T-3]
MELAFLNPLFERPGPWASVYVDTSEHSGSAPDERSLDALSVFRDLTAQGADEPTCQTVYTALEELRHSPEPVGRALFAAGGEVVLDPPLSRPPDSSPLVHWGALPHVAPLLRLADPAPVCLVAYVDRRGADFEVRGAHGARPAGEVVGRQWPLHKASTGDWSERNFRTKAENSWEHNAADIATALVACAEETRADVIVLVGGARERRAVHERLLPHLQARTVESEHG